MMKKVVIVFALLLAMLFSSCTCGEIPLPLTVVLATPSNGSVSNPQYTVLTWISVGSNTYEVQIATDASFQNTVVNASNVTALLYPVSPGTLKDNATYFWRVRALRGGQSSPWTTAWYFITSGSTPPAPPPGVPGTVTVTASMDGSTWTGNVHYTISGPNFVTGYSAPQSYSSQPAGTYTMNYISGGPSGAVLDSVSPSSTQTLSSTGNLNFDLRFRQQASSGIQVYAQLDGAPWSGSLSYSIIGPSGQSGYAVPKTFSSLAPGSYTVAYSGGGPAGAAMISISPGATQYLGSGSSTSFTFIFRSTSVSGSASVSATINGAPWSGPVSYTLAHYVVTGPVEKPGYSVPATIGDLPSGTIQLNYNSGGPAGAVMSNITPSTQQVLPSGGVIYYTMHFTQQQSYGNIMVNATLDGAPWQTAMGSGPISYSISGPRNSSGSSVPSTLSNQPTGTYIITYETGGPTGATFSGASPSTIQTLTANGTIVFTLNFRSQSRGSVNINATLNGSPWSGAVSYFVSGPYPQSGGHVPNTVSNAPEGNYSVTYSAGGPPGAMCTGVTPSSQYLPAGGSVGFTLQFVSGLLQ